LTFISYIKCQNIWVPFLTILYTFIQFRSIRTSALKFLAEIDELYATESQCLTNNEWQDFLAFLVNITGQLKSEVVEMQQAVHKFVQQCCFFQSEARTSKLAD